MGKIKDGKLLVMFVLIAALALYGFYTLLLTPKMRQVRELGDQVEAEDMTLRSMYAAAMRYERDAAQLRETVERTQEIAKNYYREEHQEDYLDTLHRMLSECGIDFETIASAEHETMNLTGAGYRSISPYTAYVPASELAGKTGGEYTLALSQYLSSVSVPDTEQMTIRIEGICTYAAMKQLIGLLAQAQKHVVSDMFSLELLPVPALPEPEEEEATEEEDAEAEAESVEQDMRFRLELRFIRLGELGSLTGEPVPEPSPGMFVMPPEFLSGDYRSGFRFSDLLRLFGGR